MSYEYITVNCCNQKSNRKQLTYRTLRALINILSKFDGNLNGICILNYISTSHFTLTHQSQVLHPDTVTSEKINLIDTFFEFYIVTSL